MSGESDPDLGNRACLMPGFSVGGSTFKVKNSGAYPRVHVDTAPVAAVGQAGGVLLTEAARATGLDRVLSEALAPWQKPFAVHDPGKVIADLGIALALGRDALADTGELRGEPGVFRRSRRMRRCRARSRPISSARPPQSPPPAPRRAEEVVERAARWPVRAGGAEVRPCPFLNTSHLPAVARIDGSCLLPPPPLPLS